MSGFNCVIQADGPADASRAQLERRLVAAHAAHYPNDEVRVSWRLVPEGYMFTEGRQSTSSIIACSLDHDTSRAEREAYMRNVCDIWTDVTGCTDHEVVVAITATTSRES